MAGNTNCRLHKSLAGIFSTGLFAEAQICMGTLKGHLEPVTVIVRSFRPLNGPHSTRQHMSLHQQWQRKVIFFAHKLGRISSTFLRPASSNLSHRNEGHKPFMCLCRAFTTLRLSERLMQEPIAAETFRMSGGGSWTLPIWHRMAPKLLTGNVTAHCDSPPWFTLGWPWQVSPEWWAVAHVKPAIPSGSESFHGEGQLISFRHPSGLSLYN